MLFLRKATARLRQRLAEEGKLHERLQFLARYEPLLAEYGWTLEYLDSIPVDDANCLLAVIRARYHSDKAAVPAPVGRAGRRLR